MVARTPDDQETRSSLFWGEEIPRPGRGLGECGRPNFGSAPSEWYTNPVRTILLSSCVSILGLLAAPTARADVYREIHGVRSEAMGGAHRGLGTSNDAITLNPAGMMLTKRYSIDGGYSYSKQDDLHHISVSLVDSKSGPVAGSLQYVYSRGDHSGADVNLHRIYASTGYAILDNFAFGTTARTTQGDFIDENGEPQEVESYSFDLGLAMSLFDLVGIGVTYHNVTTTSRKRLNPPHLGIGLAYAGTNLVVVADMEIDLRSNWLGEITARGGVEYFLDDQFPLRIGYRAVPFTRKYGGDRDYDHVIGGGLGWVTDSGSVEIAFTQSVIIQKNWDLFAGLKFFL